jgi:integrase/recombinase XerD
MSITLRKKPLSDGRLSLYLDVYTEAGRKKEFLKLYLFKRPKDELERQHNKDTLQLAQNIRSKRDLQISSQEHGFEPAFKKKVNFLEYYEEYVHKYSKKNLRTVQGSLRYFKAFAGKDYLKPNEVTEQLCIDFKEYLSQHLNGETPATYFSKFKQMLKQAAREKIFAASPALEVTNKGNGDSVKKDVLSIDDIQALASAHCGNSEVKRAFLFACVTGLRFCDIVALRWGNINAGSLKINQAKTSRSVITNLNPTAKKLLGEPSKATEAVFSLPSHTAVLKALRHWAQRAGLQKHVTFHVARHSFATNLVIFDSDINTVSNLLGHTSLKHTQKYLRVVEALKEQAVNKLPDIAL